MQNSRKEKMMDRHTPEQRKRNMQAIRNSGSTIERKLQLELWHRGLRYRKNAKAVYGKPDVVFLRDKVAVFCDSEFWHGYDWENRKEDFKSNKEFWIPKIERNIQRDIEVTEHLKAEGWIVLRFWGKDILKKTQECADIVERTIRIRREYHV